MGSACRVTTAPRVPPTHLAVVQKVDAFVQAVHSRRAADMQCRPGCSACCQVQLTVCDVEAELLREGLAALDLEARARLGARLAALDPSAACVLLEEDGRCSVYGSRPLVCRTQGLPLRYPEGVVPREALFARSAGGEGELTWCPLNFIARPPAAEDVIDAARVDTLLALSNRGVSESPMRRTAIAVLAREAIDRA